MTIIMALGITTAAWASDGEAAPIPWGTIITLSMVIITAIAGGLLGAMRRALKSSYEAMKIVSDALEDNAISDEEIKQIVKASINCQESYKDLIKRVQDLFKKSHKV